MRKISEKSKLDILALLILMFMTFLGISDKVTMKKIIISSVVFIFLFMYTIIKALRKNTFWENEDTTIPITTKYINKITKLTRKGYSNDQIIVIMKKKSIILSNEIINNIRKET